MERVSNLAFSLFSNFALRSSFCGAGWLTYDLLQSPANGLPPHPPLPWGFVSFPLLFFFTCGNICTFFTFLTRASLLDLSPKVEGKTFQLSGNTHLGYDVTPDVGAGPAVLPQFWWCLDFAQTTPEGHNTLRRLKKRIDK